MLLSLWYLFLKMVKHTQTIRRLLADRLFECVSLFCVVARKGLITYLEDVLMYLRNGKLRFNWSNGSKNLYKFLPTMWVLIQIRYKI